MIVLGIDTATPVDRRRAAARRRPRRRGAATTPRRPSRGDHAARLLVLVEQALARGRRGLGRRSTGIAVGVGPGGFTGLRIGIATARALAQARGLPLVPVSSLAALAAGAGDPEGAVAAVLDARRGEVFAGVYAGGARAARARRARARGARGAPAGAGRARAGRGGRGGTLQGGARAGRDRRPGGRLGRPPDRRRAAVPARQRRGSRPTRDAAGARLPARARRQATAAMTAPPAAAIEIRRLTYADLPAGRRHRAPRVPDALVAGDVRARALQGRRASASPPSSRASSPATSICSRFDTVWHIMNVAVDPDRHRHGIASTLLTRLFERVDDPDAQYTLEVRRSNAGAIALYERFRFLPAGVRRRYYADNGEDAVIMWRTPATLRGSLDDVPNASPAVILALETSCDDTCAAVVTPAGEVLRQRRLLAGRARPRSAAWCPRSRRATTSSWSTRWSTTRSRAAGADARRRLARRRHPGPRARRRAARRRRHRQGDRRRARGCRWRPVDHLQGHVAANFLGAGADGAAVPVPDRVRRAHAARPRRATTAATRCSGGRSTTRPARRSTRARGCSGSATRAGRRSRSSRWRAIRTAFAFPTAARVRGARLLLRRAQDRAALRGARPGGGRRPRRRAADLAASYEHAIVEALVARIERALAAEPGARLAIGGGVAANRRLRARAEALGVPVNVPPPELCTDNAAMIALRRPLGRRRSRSPTSSRWTPTPPAPAAARSRPEQRRARGADRPPGGRPAPGARSGAARLPLGARRARRDRRGGRRRLGAGRRRWRGARRPSLGDATPVRRALAAGAERRGHPGDRAPAAALARRGRRSAIPRRSAPTSSRCSDEARRAALGARARGVRLSDVRTYTRTFNGFAATVRTRDLAELPSLGVRAQPVRRFYPATAEPARVPRRSARRRAAPPLGGAPIAVLDTGVDADHPLLDGRAGPRLRRGRRRRRPRAAARAAGARRAGPRWPACSSRRASGCCRSGSPARRPPARARGRRTSRSPTSCSPGSSARSTRTATARPTTTCRSR